MKCPVCKKLDSHKMIEVHSNELDEEHYRCGICGSSWSVNHGLIEVVEDTQQRSFLESNTESVDNADYD